MSKNILLTIVMVLFIVTTLLTIVNNLTNKNSSITNNMLISPVLQKLAGQRALPSETPSVIAAPQTFKFDRSTDLKKELEGINPQLLESDFE